MRNYFAINGAPVLASAGWMCIGAAVLHFACIIGGPDWYRFLGAGEKFASAAEDGKWFPHMVTFGIASILLIWSAYAFAGASQVQQFILVGRLPFMRTTLVVISTILMARGLLIFLPGVWRLDLTTNFKFYSSVVVLVIAWTFAIGTWQAWPALSKGNL